MLSAVHISPLYPQGHNSGSHFCYGLSHTQGQNVEGRRIRPMKNPNNTIGNWTHAFRLVSQCLYYLWHHVPPYAYSRLSFKGKVNKLRNYNNQFINSWSSVQYGSAQLHLKSHIFCILKHYYKFFKEVHKWRSKNKTLWAGKSISWSAS